MLVIISFISILLNFTDNVRRIINRLGEINPLVIRFYLL